MPALGSVCLFRVGHPANDWLAGLACIVQKTDAPGPLPLLVSLVSSGLLLKTRTSSLIEIWPREDAPDWCPHVEGAYLEGLDMEDALKWADAIEVADMANVYRVAAEALENARRYSAGNV